MPHNSLRTQAGLDLHVRQVAARLNVSERTVRWYAQTGQLRARRAGAKLWAFDDADVRAFAQTHSRDREA
jgi:excisionase family DNA binding protein